MHRFIAAVTLLIYTLFLTPQGVSASTAPIKASTKVYAPTTAIAQKAPETPTELPNPNQIDDQLPLAAPDPVAVAAPAPVAENAIPEARYQVVPRLAREGTVTDVLRYTDADSADSHIFSIVHQPMYGTVTVDAAGVFTYRPGTTFAGNDFFSWRVFDGVHYSNTAIVAIEEMIGVGQTVAILDTNIDYMRADLGGGYGPDYRVVGGYDLVDNDNDPYEAVGHNHGTSVARYLASSSSGVAPGVDIVHIRMLNNFGRFHYSDYTITGDALAWVAEHLDEFANPITTINMSFEVPYFFQDTWTQIQGLNDAGIALVAGAGDGGGTPSYPAHHDHVIAAAATKINSQTSQRELTTSTNRDETVIGALASATSYAAPIVSGGAIIVREAMMAMGIEGINQDMIYQIMVDTADQIYDALTDQYYHGLNLSRAVRSVLGGPVGLSYAQFIEILQNRNRTIPGQYLPARAAGPPALVARSLPRIYAAEPNPPVQGATRPTPMAAIANPLLQYTSNRAVPAPAAKVAKKKDAEAVSGYEFKYGLLVQAAK